MRNLPIHVPVTIRNPTITEMEQCLVGCLRSQRNKVPEHIGILQMRFRIAFLCVDKAWEQHWVPDEEYWRVIAGHVPNTFFGVEFQCKSTWITESVSRSRFPAWEISFCIFLVIRAAADKDEYLPTVENLTTIG